MANRMAGAIANRMAKVMRPANRRRATPRAHLTTFQDCNLTMRDGRTGSRSADANRMANRMAKPMRSRWQNYAPNPNPNPNTQSLRPAFVCAAINSNSKLTLGNARLLGLGGMR